jgi:formylglycine-generating enzyme required for sulfatase activity
LPLPLGRSRKKETKSRPRFGSIWADAAVFATVGAGLASIVVLGFAYGGSLALSKLRSQFDQVRNKPLLTEKVSPQAPKSMDDGKRPGEEWEGNALKLKMCWCPAGSFSMGSPAAEPGRGADEDQVQKTITEGFWMGKCEVTQSEYERVVGENPSLFSPYSLHKQRPAPLPPEQASKLPVDLVSYGNAVAFCTKLTARERREGRLAAGWIYALPTETQWEYACRAGATSATAFGDKLSSFQANFDGNQPYNGAEGGKFEKQFQPVGSYTANAWGVCDMHGNAREWCRDFYTSQPGNGTGSEIGQPLDVTQQRVIRGGDFQSAGVQCRSAARSKGHLDQPDFRLGFRVVLVKASDF